MAPYTPDYSYGHNNKMPNAPSQQNETKKTRLQVETTERFCRYVNKDLNKPYRRPHHFQILFLEKTMVVDFARLLYMNEFVTTLWGISI